MLLALPFLFRCEIKPCLRGIPDWSREPIYRTFCSILHHRSPESPSRQPAASRPGPDRCQSLTRACGSVADGDKPSPYTKRQLDPYPLYGLAELFATIGREVRTGQLDPRNPISCSAVALTSESGPNHRSNAVANRVVAGPLLPGG